MARRLIGVDVGGTKIAVAVLDGTAMSKPVLAPTRTDSAETLIAQLVEAVGAAGAAGAAGEVAAVGVAVPSVVDWETGRIRSSVNIPLQDVPLRAVLRERLGVPVYIDNDATCAALAEAYDDAGRLVARNLVMFTIGTGVGGGIVIGGRIMRGATGAAAELGHTIVGADLSHTPFAHGPDHPQPGSLESLASGSALNVIAAEHGMPPGRAIDAARDGDADACAAIELLGRRLGIGIANAINTFDPELVIVGGGVSAAGEMLLGPAREEAFRFVLSGVGTRTEIRRARYGPLAGVRGAALLAAHELEADQALDAAEAATR